ncbi:hypothetical protein FQR65_LT11398 [Abscondita terminalis]|nr:hypothetical protein FQR65_LT11398 [Abscondita terminalis]
MEEAGIYEDLTDLSIGDKLIKVQEENKKLLQHIQVLEADISKLCKELTHMKERESILKKNISELFNTAMSEVNRKQRIISDLQSKIDNITVHQGRTNNFYKFSGKRNRDDNEVSQPKKFKMESSAKDYKQSYPSRNNYQLQKRDNEKDDDVVILEPKKLKIESSQRDDKHSRSSRSNYGLHKHDNERRKSAEKDLLYRDKKYTQSSRDTSKNKSIRSKIEPSLENNKNLKVNGKYLKPELKRETIDRNIPVQVDKVKTEITTRKTIVAVEKKEINPTTTKTKAEYIKSNTSSKEKLKIPEQKSDNVEQKIKVKLEDENQKKLEKSIQNDDKAVLKTAKEECIPATDTVKHDKSLDKLNHNKPEPSTLKHANKFEEKLQEIHEFDVKSNNEVKAKAILKAKSDEKKNEIDVNKSSQQEKNGKIHDSKQKLDETKKIPNSIVKNKKNENKTKQKTKTCSISTGIDDVHKEINVPEVTTKDDDTNPICTVLVHSMTDKRDAMTIPNDLKIGEETVVNNDTIVDKNKQNKPAETEKLVVKENSKENVNCTGATELVKSLNMEHILEKGQIPQLQISDKRLHSISSRRRRCVIKIVN